MGTLQIGEEILGRYKTKALVGLGASSEVFLAEDLWLDTEVVLKLVHRSPGRSASDLEKRFLSEVCFARKLSHPNVIGIYDFGKLSDEMFFISMEYCPAGSLQGMLERNDGKPMLFQQALHYLLQLASALHFAHEADIVHRDIKPANILISSDAKLVKLCDFGCANSIELPAGLTRTGCILGTPEYMAPEQFEGNRLDGRTDIYALGVLAFELVTGKLPFVSDSIPTLMASHMAKKVPRISKINPDVPDWFEVFVEVCMEKNPNNRFRNAHEVLSILFPRFLKLGSSDKNLFLPSTVLVQSPKTGSKLKGLFAGTFAVGN